MLDDLMQTIETLKARIRAHRDALENSESRTRVALIDPMLCALGWNVSDPDLVEIEPNVADGWADYALLGVNRKPVIFVEAKKLSIVNPPVEQMIRYAVGEGFRSSRKVQYCAWTNGDKWEAFDISAQDPVMKVSITRDDAAKCALHLLSLWRPSLQDGGFETAIEPLVGMGDGPPPPPPSGWIPLNGEFDITGTAPPLAVRLPDGKERPIKHWVDILIEIAQWLHGTGKLTQENCRIPAGRLSYLLSSDGKHQDGSDFTRPHPIGNGGIVLSRNHSARDSIYWAKFLLERFGQDPGQVAIKRQ